jgi:vitamin B12 transporter
MKQLLLILTLLALTGTNEFIVYAQNSDSLNILTVKISGRVMGADQKPLNGANIVIEGTIDGATTDSTGYFEFETSKTGKQNLIVTSVDYKEQSKEITIEPGKNIEINFRLYKSEVVTEEIIVTASTYTSGQSSQVMLTPLEIARVPGSDADLFRALTTFPGSNQVDEGSKITVRGGDVSEVLTIIDQATVYNPFLFDDDYNTSTYSTIDPWGLRGINFSSGGFSARWGNALSAVLDLKSYEMPQLTGLFVWLGLTGPSISGAYLSKDKKIGASIEASRTFMDPFFKLNRDNTDFSPVPLAQGIGGTVSYKLSKTGFLKLYADYSGDRIGIRNTSPSYDGYFKSNTDNYFSNLKLSAGSNSTYLDASLSFSYHRKDMDYGVLNDIEKDYYSKFRVDLTHTLSKIIRLNTGAEYEYDENRFGGTVPIFPYDIKPGAPSYDVNSNKITARTGGYIESEFRFSKKFFSVAGIRTDVHTLSKQITFDPRLSLGYKIAKDNIIRGAVGLYHQYPELLYYAQTLSNNLKPQQAVHYILGYELNKLNGVLLFRVEAYYKDYRSLVLYDNNSFLYNTNGSGYARGVDVFLKSSIVSKYTAWISYSYTDSKRRQYNAAPLTSADYDITHSLTFVGSYNITDNLTAGISYKISTGKSYTPVTGSYYDSSLSIYAPIDGIYNSDRFPVYQRMDANLQYVFFIFGRFAVGVIALNNLLNNRNLYGYTYNSDYTQKLKIYYTNRRIVYLGLGFQI